MSDTPAPDGRTVLQDQRKVRVVVNAAGKPFRTFEGYNEDELLRDANVLKAELVSQGKADVSVKVMRSILG